MLCVAVQNVRFTAIFLFGITLLLATALTAVSAHAEGLMVNGTVFSDDFEGSALNETWVGDGSPEVDPSSSLVVADGQVTFHSGTAVYNYVAMWGDTTQLSGLGDSTDWWAEVSFQVTGPLTTTDPTRDFHLLSGRRTMGAGGDNTGIDFRLVQDESGAEGDTFSLGWNGYDLSAGDREATVIGTLDKDVSYVVSAHRKSDGNVDIYLDGTLISTQEVLGSEGNPLMWRIGESAGTASVDDVALDYVYVGEGSGAEPLAGDLNSDGFVGGDDLDIVRSFWGQTVPAGDLLSGDPSKDGFVGGDDLDIVRANWGQGTPPAPSAVPEPSTFILFVTGVLSWLYIVGKKWGN